MLRRHRDSKGSSITKIALLNRTISPVYVWTPNRKMLTHEYYNASCWYPITGNGVSGMTRKEFDLIMELLKVGENGDENGKNLLGI